MRRTCSIVFLAGLTLLTQLQSLCADVIVVADGCTLADAIESANRDRAIGGCPARTGFDEIHLTDHRLEPNPLPTIASAIALVGNGLEIELSQPLRVAADSHLAVYSTEVSGGASETGAAIESEGSLALVNSTLSPGDLERKGGAVFSEGKIRVVNSRFIDSGGAEAIGGETGALVIAQEAEAYVRDTVFAGNAYGAFFSDFFSRVEIRHSTFVASPEPVEHNVVVVFGKGRLVNNTLSGLGGGAQRAKDGIYLAYDSDTRLHQNTITDFYGTPLHTSYGGDLAAGDSIFGPSSEEDCQWGGFFFELTNLGGNFDSDGSCGNAGTIGGLDPELSDHGGTTPTHALFPDSPMIDAGIGCESPVDQRGLPRDREACDSGAFEYRESFLRLRTRGSCPGTVEIEVIDAAPGSSIELFSADRYGVTELTDGPCTGEPIGLELPISRAVLAADASGRARTSLSSTIEMCDDIQQAIDLSTCTVSTAAAVGSPPP